MRKDYDVLIHYLYHSGFALELANHFIVFDYYKGDIGTDNTSIVDGKATLSRLVQFKNIMVMISHGHHDHLNPKVFDWSNKRPDINYIISDDVKMDLHNVNYTLVKPYEKMDVKGVKISTFGSTDIGLSFLVNINGLKIFHAGDLNWWHWADESSDEELIEAKKYFLKETSIIENDGLDIMFFPVDPRLEKHYYLGGEYMIKKFKPKLFVPMHFGNRFEITKMFDKRMCELDTECVEIHKNGQVIAYRKNRELVLDEIYFCTQ